MLACSLLRGAHPLQLYIHTRIHCTDAAIVPDRSWALPWHLTKHYACMTTLHLRHLSGAAGHAGRQELRHSIEELSAGWKLSRVKVR